MSAKMRSRNPRSASELLKTTCVALSFCLLTVFAGCASTPSAETPQTARTELALRGIDYDEKSFVFAATHDDYVSVRLFITAGMNPNARDSNGDPVLIPAMKNGYTKVVQALLAGHADVNAVGSKGMTPLMHMASDGSSDMVRLLLDQGASINAKSTGSDGGATALMFAALSNWPDIMQLLIERGADVNARNNEDQTALLWAVSYNRTQAANMLLEHGADPNIATNLGRTPLMIAAANGYGWLVDRLLERDADPRARDKQGMTAADWAIKGHHQDMAQKLTSSPH